MRAAPYPPTSTPIPTQTLVSLSAKTCPDVSRFLLVSVCRSSRESRANLRSPDKKTSGPWRAWYGNVLKPPALPTATILDLPYPHFHLFVVHSLITSRSLRDPPASQLQHLYVLINLPFRAVFGKQPAVASPPPHTAICRSRFSKPPWSRDILRRISSPIRILTGLPTPKLPSSKRTTRVCRTIRSSTPPPPPYYPLPQ